MRDGDLDPQVTLDLACILMDCGTSARPCAGWLSTPWQELTLSSWLIWLGRRMAPDTAVMSYAGQLNLTAVADRDRCTHVEVCA